MMMRQHEQMSWQWGGTLGIFFCDIWCE